ncbi:glycosyltransferase [Streptococcus sp. zg-86]|uniref:Glycosyltransferase n=1 Tax=Streptococcus zhangguiae TaxID=2664091 RepID=A0A6I4RGT7_9STRE|nr:MULTISPECIES: glycosyltransferase family 2 protein [unclassified Streptococcus]MTB65142.1 glycosyltransferase [Streptococcus sp. zg-86]MTB91402.1 glycosyltransferase [Streptococcus sp. zg-36]MWV57130.1 glycosyltransferase [Streptococcus sp. zg-70]QTH47134.1 glycosyltransferase [Streptococcus sp. zg-86]
MDKKFSIILPFYNAEATIQLTLDSIVQQNQENFEIICVDDCSTDRSLKIVQNYSENYSNFKVVSLTSNVGVSEARNVALNQAKGEFILFVDADDLLPRNFIDFLNHYKFKEEYDLLIFNYDTIYQQIDVGYTYPTQVSVRKLTVEECQDAIIGIKSGKESCPTRLTSLWAKVFRRKIIESNQLLFDSQLKIGEDSLFVFDYLQFVSEIHFYDVIAYYYYQNSRSLTHSFQPQMVENDVAWQLAFSERVKKIADTDKQEKYRYYSLAKGLLNICYLFIGHKGSSFSINQKKECLKAILENPMYQDLWKIPILNELLASFSLQEHVLLYLLKNRQYLIIIWIFQLKNRMK